MIDVPDADWAVADANVQAFVCKRCGVTEPFPPMGLLLQQFADVCAGFVLRHKDCQP